jgi:cytochrome c oxidase subunit IV
MDAHDTSMGLYYKIYAALMALLILTVGAAYLHTGLWALPIALTIAVIKAVLVIVYFMHMRFTGKLMWVWLCVGVIWLCMLLFGILTDVIMRVS